MVRNVIVYCYPRQELHQFLTLTNNLRLKMVCYYALGKSYDILDDTDQAFNYFTLANKLQSKLTTFKTALSTASFPTPGPY